MNEFMTKPCNVNPFSVRLLAPTDAQAYLYLKPRALKEGPDLFAMTYEEYADTGVSEPLMRYGEWV